MPFHLRKDHLTRIAIAALLVLAVLFAQGIGMIHRIAHADFSQGKPVVLLSFSDPASATACLKLSGWGSEEQHSCAAFDAATLADLAPVPAVLMQTLPGSAVLALWAAFNSWDAPFQAFFSSRAPPLS